VRIAITRGKVGVTIDAPSGDTRGGGSDASEEVMDRLQRAMRAAGVHVLRQLPSRLIAEGDPVQLAERARAWLVAAGCEVVVGDW